MSSPAFQNLSAVADCNPVVAALTEALKQVCITDKTADTWHSISILEKFDLDRNQDDLHPNKKRVHTSFVAFASKGLLSNCFTISTVPPWFFSQVRDLVAVGSWACNGWLMYSGPGCTKRHRDSSEGDPEKALQVCLQSRFGHCLRPNFVIKVAFRR